jgi:FSR family fosmidomycin resistance protein-like MFS transporter
MGVLAGQGRRRRLVILGGGIVFLITLLAVASARSFAVLLAAFVAFYPASGAFVSLTQAEIMDARPDRQAQVMARWDLAGAAGAVAGPLLLTAVLASGGGWRAGYLVLAGISALIWLGALLRGRPQPDGRPDGRTRRTRRRRKKRSSGRGRRDSGRSAPRCGIGERCAGCC